ncbi:MULTISPECIES: ABC transporter permease [unclassified Rathayibacter]|uniref:ABC transporter permease n=1 Tax=unclassified Rathayibacter TaxID=2609250 RepID=UPI000F4BD308|nr:MULTISPECIES: ABC transporter permease [unclassified Rathayibacter]ROP49080.1 monosaccharide ABC transporter membrane protein (CUT2 family) [Rathayibacter sp. PhB186]ROS50803.1 monosaccharide ABC transporter membrane protein (CUT2 family) [Rathayibacter sp. PhB185]
MTTTTTPTRLTTRAAGLLRFRELPVAAGLIVLVVATTLVNPRFLAPQSVKDLMLNATILMILAAGQSLVLITRNVDLSVGSILGISGFLTGTLFASSPGIPIPLVFLAGIAIGALLGGINGLLVTSVKVPALVITLGTLYIYRGVNNAWAGGREYFSGDRPQAFGDLSVDTFLGVPLITIVAVLVIAVLAVVLAGTRPGRDLYAIGSDPDAATAFGIRSGTRVFTAFLVNGALAGLAGVLYASRFSSVGATTGSGLELDVVAAAVVGGVAISGGSGTVIGAAIGALLLTTITSSLTAVQIDKFWQQAVVGALILLAIIVDRIAALRTARRNRISEARK